MMLARTVWAGDLIEVASGWVGSVLRDLSGGDLIRIMWSNGKCQTWHTDLIMCSILACAGDMVCGVVQDVIAA